MTLDNQPKMPHYKISIDPGFHSIKVALIHDGKLYTYTLLSAVGVGDTSLGQLQTGITKQKKNKTYKVSFENQSFIVGPDVDMYTRPTERLDLDRLRYSVELRALIYVSLGGLLSQILGDHHIQGKINAEISLLIALPVQVLQSKDSKQSIQSLESWMIGSHEFDLEGSQYFLNVIEIKPMAQPMGSFFEWGLNSAGDWERSITDLKSSIGILDQGFNTVDLFHLRDGQIVKRFTSGETLGQRRAAKILQDLVTQKTGRKISLFEADKYIRQSSNGMSIFLPLREEKIDLKPLTKQAVDVAAGELQSFISLTWDESTQFDVILITGGGSLVINSRLRSIFPRALELPDPVTANARGLAKFAQREGILR